MTEEKGVRKLPPPPDPEIMVAQLTEYAARLFYHLAGTVVERFGEEGAQAVRDAIHAFGVERGRRVRHKVEEAGLAVTQENEYKYHDLPIGSSAWQGETRQENNCHITHVTRCPFGNTWKELGANEIGLLYCDIDYAIWEGYQPQIEFQLTKNILKGDPYCEMIYKWRGENEEK
ncbi:MAG: L-2-amino-thiazoline-4-carboxylic acid hydrolase [Bacillota bacterium]